MRTLPVILVLPVYAVLRNNIPFAPPRTVLHKKRKPYRAGYAHQGWLQCQQNKRVYTHPPKEAAVFKGKTNSSPPQKESCNTDGYSKPVTDHVGTIVKPWFHVQRLPAHRARVVHLHGVFQQIWIPVLKHVTSSAAGTFRRQKAENHVWFFILFLCTHGLEFIGLKMFYGTRLALHLRSF